MEFTQEIFDRINSFDTITAGCKAIADETGCSYKALRNYYYNYKKIKNIDYSCHKLITEKCKDIAAEVAKHPDNLCDAFRIVAEKYNTTFIKIQKIYYHHIKNNPDYPIFTIISEKSGHMNVKNNIGNKYPKYKTNHSFIEKTWGKIKFFINNILK